MALESGTYLDDLVTTNPTASDNVSAGDDHLRLLKTVLKNSFPSVDAAVNAIHTGSSAPSTGITQGLLWLDTTNSVLKLYDGSSWVVLPISPGTSYKIMGSLTAGWTLPTADGTDGQVMKTDGSGALSFVDPGSVLTAGEGIDITSNTISGEDASTTNKGIASFAAGEGMDVSVSSGAVTYSGEDASDTNKGIATFNTANFANSSGDITIKDGGVANAELADMAANTVKVRDANSSGVPSDKAVADTEILIGDGTGFTAASLSGDATMTNAGAVSVTGIQGTAVSSTAPTNDQYMKYSSTASEWQMVSIVGTDKLTTKGDLLVYNTVDSETRLAVGTNDYVLVADSTATNGVDWQQVATAGIANDAVTADKLADTAVTPGSYTASAITVDQQGRITAASSGSFISKTSATGSGQLPSGTTAQRDGSPSAGMIRYNSTTGGFEGYGAAWGSIGGGAAGAGGDEIFYENEQNVTTSYSITSNENAMSAGPVTVDSGATVTIPSGSTWVIV